MYDSVNASMSATSAANANYVSTSMLKKSLDFQGDLANSLINGSINVTNDQLRNDSMHKLGIGQNLNITA